jgi:hypothetical protein
VLPPFTQPHFQSENLGDGARRGGQAVPREKITVVWELAVEREGIGVRRAAAFRDAPADGAEFLRVRPDGGFIAASVVPRLWQRSEAADVDRRQRVYPSLERHRDRHGPERARPGRWAARGREKLTGGSSARGLSPASRADPVGRLVPGQHVADTGDAAVLITPDGEPLQREGGPRALPQEIPGDGDTETRFRLRAA